MCGLKNVVLFMCYSYYDKKTKNKQATTIKNGKTNAKENRECGGSRMLFCSRVHPVKKKKHSYAKIANTIGEKC